VSVVGDTLTIKGETKVEEEEKGTNYIRRERRYGSFSRSLAIPTNVVADKAVADFSKGILTLRLPKAEEVKPKRIEIKSR
jgi:HSP20 family protein